MYDRLGGQPAVRRIVDRLYASTLRDDKLYHRYFEGVDMVPLRAHMVMLLSQLLSGSALTFDLGKAHAGLNITNDHYDRVGDYLIAAIRIEHVPTDVLIAIEDTLEAVRPLIVTVR
jgi:hemoglobin